MQSENWKKVKELLGEVLDIEPAGRRAFLNSSPVTAAVRSEVESLLAFEESSETMMFLPAVDFLKDTLDDDEAGDSALVGQQIGAYRVVRELGHGGMGAVYLAERTDEKFKQRVALKLLKREMNTSELRKRFQQEREILASLEHPNIARLLDAGTSDDGIPYIAMEYVDGLTILDYCNTHDLDLNARLELFREVCGAVEYAHQNLVIHRDLKPSNVLVSTDGRPKLLDFGISKFILSGTDTADAATITRMGVMTPSYASPEQLQKKSVNTLSDVYSLGVILFEMLSNHRPFEDKEHDLREIYSAVLERDPVPPSSLIGKEPTGRRALSVVDEPSAEIDEPATRPSNARHTGPAVVTLSSSSVRGDLDNIVLKALRKEPERRYSSASNLADDIHRHLMGLTVSARPNTFSYRTSKFIARNRFGVAGVAVLLLAILAGLATTLWQARVARAERARAEKRFNDVRKLANANLFDVYPEVENLEGSLKAREIILTNSLEYLDSLFNEAGNDRELQKELATAYEKVGDVQGAMNNSSLGDTQAGLNSYEKARVLREAILAADPKDLEAKEKLANNYSVTGRTLWYNSRTREAEAAFETAVKLRRELVAAQPESVDSKNRLAALLLDYGAIPSYNFQSDRALELFNESVAIIDALQNADPDNPDYKKTRTRAIRIVSKTKSALGDYDGALRDLRLAMQINNDLAKAFPKDFRVLRSIWLTEAVYCETLIDSGSADAVEACRATIAFPQAALEKEPENGVVAYDLAISHYNASRAHRLAGEVRSSIASAQKAVDIMSELSAKTPKDMEYRRNLAVYTAEIGWGQLKLAQYDAAIGSLRKVTAGLIPVIEADPETSTYKYDLAMAYRLSAEAFYKKGDKAAAVENIDAAREIIEKLRSINALRASDKNLPAELEQERSNYTG